MCTCLVVAVEAGPRGDGRRLAAEVFAVAHVLPAHAEQGVVMTRPVMAVIKTLNMIYLATILWPSPPYLVASWS